jgi:hypothetical protein
MVMAFVGNSAPCACPEYPTIAAAINKMDRSRENLWPLSFIEYPPFFNSNRTGDTKLGRREFF